MEVLAERSTKVWTGRHGQGAETEPVVRRVEDQELRAILVRIAVMKERGLRRDLESVRSRNGEERLCRLAFRALSDRHQIAQPPRQLDTRGVGRDVSEPVQQPLALQSDGTGDARVAVADGGDAESCGQIDEAVAVDIDDVRSQRFVPQQTRSAAVERIDAGRLHFFQLGAQSSRLRAGYLGGDLRRLGAGSAEARSAMRHRAGPRARVDPPVSDRASPRR